MVKRWTPLCTWMSVLLSAFLVSSCSVSKVKGDQRLSYHPVYGKSVLLRSDGRAVAPKSAPREVHLAVAAGNRLIDKPYRMGGGHRKHEDSAYDCSGTVSYLLRAAGKMNGTMPSSAFRKYGKKGPGKWITIYVRSGHVFMTVGDLRMDTGWGKGAKGPRWRTNSRPIKGYEMRHPPGL